MGVRDKILSFWARSSMVEQWVFNAIEVCYNILEFN